MPTKTAPTLSKALCGSGIFASAVNGDNPTKRTPPANNPTTPTGRTKMTSVSKFNASLLDVQFPTVSALVCMETDASRTSGKTHFASFNLIPPNFC